jgi:hypothetical protein
MMSASRVSASTQPRYYMDAVELVVLSRMLRASECSIIMNACNDMLWREPNGTWGDTPRGQLGANSRDLAAEWGIDGPTLLATLDPMPEALMRVLARAIDRFRSLYMDHVGRRGFSGTWCLAQTGLVRCQAGHSAARPRGDCEACVLIRLGAFD